MRILLIANSEICHQPRLIKAADFFESRGWLIAVFSPVIGLADPQVYSAFKESRKNWTFIENDLSGSDWWSKVNWIVSGAVFKLSRFLFQIRIPLLNELFANKALVTARIKGTYEVVIVNSVDNLPFACKLKARNKARVVVYDSQEFFQGQFLDKQIANFYRRWISKNERKFVTDVDIVTTTTDVLKNRLIKEFNLLPSMVLRVRNVPNKTAVRFGSVYNNQNVLRCVWHGFRVALGNERGVELLLEAVSKLEFPVSLTLQGRLSSVEFEQMRKHLDMKGISEIVQIRSSVDPDKIVESLSGFHVGLIGEISVNENQRLTSSNKLFDYIAAGLMVIAPNLPGIAETFDEHVVGFLYEPGNVSDLTAKLRQVYANPELVMQCRINSENAFTATLNWQADYEATYLKIKNLVS